MLNTLIGTPLGYLMYLCYALLHDYGLAILLFTLLTKVLLFPLNIWVQRNSIKMIELQPEINRIAAKYAGDRDKVAEEQFALYKQKKYRPLASLVPLLIQIPIILGLIAVIYNPLQHLLHMETDMITAFIQKAEAYTGTHLGSTAQLKVMELVTDPETVDIFRHMPVTGDVDKAISAIQSMKTDFLGFHLSHFPDVTTPDKYLLVPLLSGLSALLLCVVQNRENVLQKEQGFLSKWGTTLLLVVFSTYFGFVVPAGVALYWVAGNLLAIVIIYILNWMYNPKEYIDYQALEESKQQLAASKALEKKRKPTKEQKAKSKADYARFHHIDNVKQLVYYSEKSGFYKYYEDQIGEILKRSDLVIHYITSDYHDAIFSLNNPRIIPYYIDDNRLIPLFMKMEAEVVVMTTPNLQTYHLKRSLVKKDVEYIYTPHDPLSTHMAAAKGAFDHFDTVLCVGQHQIDELRETEQVYGLKPKKLVPCGYPLIDRLLAAYEDMDVQNPVKKLLIAPSWQEGNILESCIDQLLEALLGQGYDITVRPHPEFIKRYPAKMNSLLAKYESRFDEHFRMETDFSSNTTIFTSDLLITDWSGIAYEFSYATKKPCLFINTPMKVMNPEYQKISCVPIEISLRDQIGMSIAPEQVATARQAVETLLSSGDTYREQIEKAMEKTLFNPGNSAVVGAEYIIGAVKGHQQKDATP